MSIEAADEQREEVEPVPVDPPDDEVPADADDTPEGNTDEDPAPEVEPVAEEPDAPLAIVLGDDAEAPPPAPDKAAAAWAKERVEKRELKKRVQELEAKVAQAAPPPAPQLPPLGAEPKISDPEIAYDGEALKKAIRAHDDLARKHAEAKATVENAAKRESDDWKARIDSHTKKVADLAVADYEDAAEVVAKTLNPVQRAIIVKAAKNSASLFYAIGKNEARAKTLAAITDPVEFAATIGRLEARTSMDDKRTAAPPPPPKRIAGTGAPAGDSSKTRQRLEDEAARTNDRTKVIEYDRLQRQKKK